MSNVFGSSSSSGPRGRGRVFGVPKRCWCGTSVCQLNSKSSPNSYRHYYRCCYAADEQLRNDDHVFNWVDEAHLNEIRALQQINGRLEKEVKEMLAERNTRKDIVSEKMEVVLFDSASRVKKTIIDVVIVCMVMIGCHKFVG